MFSESRVQRESQQNSITFNCLRTQESSQNITITSLKLHTGLKELNIPEPEDVMDDSQSALCFLLYS